LKGRVMDIAGRRFGRITVISLSHINKNSYWHCKCDCGNEFIAIGNNMIRGKQVSCGCFKKELTGELRRTHGETKTRFYQIWAKMKSRTLNKNDGRYGDYGGRGISIHEKWVDYQNFKSDMYASYLKHINEFGEYNTTIDRVDNDGNYCKDNCKWATYKEQNANRRNTVKLDYHGVIYSITEASRKFNINPSTLKDRLRNGMDLEQALTAPVKGRV
jgi:hypothetical protein